MQEQLRFYIPEECDKLLLCVPGTGPKPTKSFSFMIIKSFSYLQVTMLGSKSKFLNLLPCMWFSVTSSPSGILKCGTMFNWILILWTNFCLNSPLEGAEQFCVMLIQNAMPYLLLFICSLSNHEDWLFLLPCSQWKSSRIHKPVVICNLFQFANIFKTWTFVVELFLRCLGK